MQHVEVQIVFWQQSDIVPILTEKPFPGNARFPNSGNLKPNRNIQGPQSQVTIVSLASPPYQAI